MQEWMSESVMALVGSSMPIEEYVVGALGHTLLTWKLEIWQTVSRRLGNTSRRVRVAR